MKVPYNEDLAIHIGPESCGGSGNTAAEALTGEIAGGLLISENTAIRVPTLLPDREGHICYSEIASYIRTLRSLRTWHARKPSARESGDPRILQHPQTGIGESSIEKSPGASVGVLNRCKPRTRNQGAGVWMGWRRRGAVRPAQNDSGKSDNNIVPEKQANNGNRSPRRSQWR